jgi:drug/metabolite transporter (DMT)-like permease
MLNGGTPLFVAVVASVIARRLPPRGQVLGLAIGFGGVVLIALPSIRESSSSMFGVVLILIALVMYGFSLNVASPLQQQYGSLPVFLHHLASIHLSITIDHLHGVHLRRYSH